MRRIYMMILVVALALLPISAFAATTYTVTFDGSALTDDFNGDEMNEKIGGMEPGDTVKFKVRTVNEADDTDWYISNKIITSFEDNEKASGGAYSYKLTYTPDNGSEKVLYSSDTVGGESTTGGTGLHQASGALEDYFYMDTMKKDSTGLVTLEVGLDGETQNNSYQDATSAISLQFAVDVPETIPGNPDDEDADGTKTGDDTNLIPYAIALIIAGLLLMAIALGRSKKQVKEGRNDE